MSRFSDAPLESDPLLPGVDAERCVHVQIEQASCRACVDACPAHAWVIDDTMLGIDSSRCDGCGLCAPVCPERAIEPLFRPLLLQTTKTRLALTICDRAAESCREPGWVPCLQAIGVVDLLLLRQQGVDALLVARGDCDACSRNSNARLDARVNHANRLLLSRGATGIGCRELGSHAWRRARQRLTGDEQQLGLRRRAFFDTLVKRLNRQAAELAGGEAAAPVSHDLLLPGSPVERATRPALHSFVPVIDRARCTGCDACIRICPHAALMLDDEESGYRIRASHCTGCSLCVDLCEPLAIRVERLVESRQQQIPLLTNQCSACGIRFHVPVPPEAPGGSNASSTRASPPLCSVCNRHHHQDNLFQVLDA